MSYFAEIDALKRQHEDLVARTVEYARSQGGEEVTVRISEDKGLELSARRRNDVENIEFNQRREMTVYVTKGKRNASASTCDFSWDKVKAAVDAAVNLSQYSSPDEYSGLCDAELLYRGDRDLKQLYPYDENVDAMVKRVQDLYNCGADLADQLKDKGMRSCERAEFSTWYSVNTMGTSHGFLKSTSESTCSKDVSFLAAQGDELQRSSGFSYDCDFSKLWSDERVAKEGAERTLNRLGGKQIPTGTYPIIFTGRAAQTFLAPYLSAVSGRLIHRNSSFLLNSVGTQVFPEFFTLREDPWVEGRAASMNYDEDGVAMYPMTLVENGKVCTYLLGTYASRKLKLPCNGHASGTSNLFVEAGEEHTLDFAQLLKQAGKGFVVESLMGQGVNLVTGNYSRGAMGYYFENGERVHAVNEVTIAANLKDMYANLAYLGNDYDERYRIKIGSVLVPDVTVSGS